MVQRSTSWSGATSLHETRNLAEIVLGSEPPVTWQLFNGRTLLTQADADAAINYPTVVTSGGGTSWTAKITNVPNQDGAEDETVLSAGPWTMATTKGALQNLTSDVACTGGDAATLARLFFCRRRFVHRIAKLATNFDGVSVDELLALAQPLPTATHVLATSTTGYTTNLPIEDVSDGRAWVAWAHEGQALTPEHGGPVRLLVPHLYFWKSAKWVTRLTFLDHDERGFWEQNGYHDRGDPWKEQRYQGD